MASLREIHDTSNLRYDTDLGVTTGDSDSGQPNQFGLIRTGENATTVPVPGIGNCNGWTTAAVGAFGTGVTPRSGWDSPAFTVDPWLSNSVTCAAPQRVWCVQD
jgi:hypothetical protein